MSTLGDQTGPIFAAVLAVCDRRGPITGDAGYHSEANLRTLAASQEPALIADKYLLRRDVSFATQERYTTRPHPLHDKAEPARKPLAVFGPQDFQCARSAGRACVRPTCHCSDGAPRG